MAADARTGTCIDRGKAQVRAMRYDSEHKARTRDRVLKAAAAALRAEGPDRLGVADVMNRAQPISRLTPPTCA